MVKDYVVFDLETTGLSPDKDTIIEIGALKVIQGKVADRFSEFINPHQKLPQQISNNPFKIIPLIYIFFISSWSTGRDPIPG